MKRTIDVPWNATQAVLVFAASWIGVPLVVTGILRLLAIVSPQAQSIINRLASSDITTSFILVLLDAMVDLWLVKRILDKYQATWADVGLRRVNLGKAMLYVAGALLSFVVLVAVAFALVSLLLPHFNADQAQVNEFTKPQTNQALRLSFLALVVIPPPVEEIIFRGFIFPAMAKRWGVVVGAIFTSLLFAVAHWQLNISVYTLVLSLLLCFMYYKLRSIWPGIILHMLNNYLAFTALVHK